MLDLSINKPAKIYMEVFKSGMACRVLKERYVVDL